MIIRTAFSLRVRGRRSCAVLSNRDHRLKAQYQNKTKKKKVVTECDLSRGSRRRRGRFPTDPPRKTPLTTTGKTRHKNDIRVLSRPCNRPNHTWVLYFITYNIIMYYIAIVFNYV